MAADDSENGTCWTLISSGVEVKGDPDIAGTGVIIAFIFSATATLLAVLLAFLSGLVDDGLLRPVDRFVLRVPSRAEKWTRTHVALRKAILTLSDQQIVTGIAILVAKNFFRHLGKVVVLHCPTTLIQVWRNQKTPLHRKNPNLM